MRKGEARALSADPAAEALAMMNVTTKEIEAAALTAWSEFIQMVPHVSDIELAKKIFVCGFARGAPFGWQVSERNKPEPE
jgi:hypothetical protein